MVSIKDEAITPSFVLDTCTVYVQEDVKMKNHGKIQLSLKYMQFRFDLIRIFSDELLNHEQDPLLQSRETYKRKLGVQLCDKCEYNATYSYWLNRHIKSKHEGVRYSCDKCEYNATNSYWLNRHIKSKHERVRYSCETCKYVATTVGSLKSHIEIKHKGLRYPCN